MATETSLLSSLAPEAGELLQVPGACHFAHVDVTTCALKKPS